MTKSSLSAPSTRSGRIWIRLACVLVAALLLYAALGFFAVPPVVRAVANSQVEKNLHATIQIDSVSFNPFTLRLRLEGLSVRDLEEKEVLRLGGGQFAVSLSSVVHFAPVLKEALLDEPVAHVSRNADGEINLLQLLKETDEEPGELPKLAINRLSITRGAVEFSDSGLREPFSFSISPISFDLEDFSTFREEGNRLRFSALDTHGGSVWGRGTLTVKPMTASAELEIEGFDLSAFALYVGEFADVDLREGSLDLELAVEFQAESLEETISGNLRSLTVSDLGLFAAGNDVPFLTLGRVEVSNARFAAWDPRVEVESVRVSEGRARVRRLEDGSIDWIQMLLPAGVDGVGGAEEPGDPFPLAFSAGLLDVNDFQFEVEDLATGSEARLAGTLTRGEFRAITEDLGRPIPISLEGELTGEGRFQISGELAPDPLAGELDVLVEEIPLTRFDPWVGLFADLSLSSGAAGLNGKVTLAEGAGELPDVTFTGSAGVKNFEAREGEEPVLKFAQLDLDGLVLESEPLSFRSGLVRLQSPEGRVVLEEDGNLNLLRLLRMTPPGEAGTEGASPAETAPGGASLTYALVAVEVDDGKVALFDQSITPHYATELEAINVRMKDLESDPGSRATVNVSGRFPGASRIEISGKTNAQPAQLFADMTVQLTGFILPPVSSYSGEFIGRAISSGSLDVQVIVMVEGDSLSAWNAILIRDLRLGERVESSSAPSLPLDLALALLRNRNGEISIDLPLSGQLQDPQFSIAAVATDAFFTVIRNMASSPFAALGNLVGARSEQLSQVDFRPGQFELSEEQRGVLRSLAEALHQRPALHLEARGKADPVADRPVLKERRLAERLAAHRSESAGKTDATAGDPLDDSGLVRSYYELRFGLLEPPSEPEPKWETETKPVDEIVEAAASPEVEFSDEDPVSKAETRPRSWIAVDFFGRSVWPRTPRQDELETVTADESLPIPEEPEVPKKRTELEEVQESPPAIEIPSMREMKAHLLTLVEISDEDLHDLARSRAETVRAALLETGRVEEKRVSIAGASLEAGPRVVFDLR